MQPVQMSSPGVGSAGQLCIDNWRPLSRGTLEGTFSIIFPDFGLCINGCLLREEDGKQWISLPRDCEIDEVFRAAALAALYAYIATLSPYRDGLDELLGGTA